jgi:hypothetical protein
VHALPAPLGAAYLVHVCCVGALGAMRSAPTRAPPYTRLFQMWAIEAPLCV